MPGLSILGAGLGGFFLMSLVGMQALIALFSSVPLAKRRHRTDEQFDLNKAMRRILRTTLFSTIVVAVTTALVLCYTSFPTILNYLFGMILGFLLSIRHMSPNNAQNQAIFDRSFRDCYPQEDLDATRNLSDVVHAVREQLSRQSEL